ncbi:MAG: hypothetical protein ABF611_02740 [Acetobacter orientalis]|uniref:hypothetical protein n=1 Tax=Acetobacter orientalis TaxID=146474 RepID=UPI0039EACCB6
MKNLNVFLLENYDDMLKIIDVSMFSKKGYKHLYFVELMHSRERVQRAINVASRLMAENQIYSNILHKNIVNCLIKTISHDIGAHGLSFSDVIIYTAGMNGFSIGNKNIPKVSFDELDFSAEISKIIFGSMYASALSQAMLILHGAETGIDYIKFNKKNAFHILTNLNNNGLIDLTLVFKEIDKEISILRRRFQSYTTLNRCP